MVNILGLATVSEDVFQAVKRDWGLVVDSTPPLVCIDLEVG
jgi:hypothetical protein